MNDNEKLIEEAAKAIYEAQVEEATCGDLARAALAVFEKAHTPTDAQAIAALHKYHGEPDRIGFVWAEEAIEGMRAALHAAGGTR